MDEGENFKEAVDSAHTLWSPPSVSSELKRYFESPKCTDPNAESTDFWVVLAAIRAFVAQEGGGLLPLPGAIPDMTATTDLYLDLKRLYESKAEADVEAVCAHVKRILGGLQRDPSSISRDYVKLFCKNAMHVRVIHFPTIEEESKCFCATTKDTSSYIQSLLFSEDTAENAFVYSTCSVFVPSLAW